MSENVLVTGSSSGIGRAVVERWGPPDVLVNNAGWAAIGPVEELEEGLVRGMFETNLFGLLRVVQTFAPGMRERGSPPEVVAERVLKAVRRGGRINWAAGSTARTMLYLRKLLRDTLFLWLVHQMTKVR